MKRIDPQDVIAAIGLILVVVGIGRWSLNTALIVAGLMLFLFAYITTPRTPKPPQTN